MRSSSRSVHLGGHSPASGPVVTPISVASTYRWESFDQEPDWVYSRYGNANRQDLERASASLEEAKHGFAFASGMAAIMAALSLAKSGDHLLVAEQIYGGTVRAARNVLSRYGYTWSTFNAMDPASLEAAIRPNSALAIFESPTNPLCEVCDLRALADVCRQNGLISVVDNTFATPILQRPLGLGADVSVHSTSKFMGGHSDHVGGVACVNRDDLAEIISEVQCAAGAIPGPFDCFLACRGIRSLAVRVRAQCAGAMAVAKALHQMPGIEKVFYPGLPDSPGHAIAKTQMDDFGSVLAFAVRGGAEEAKHMASGLRLITLAASLGGCETILSYPPVLSHAYMTEEERAAAGILPNIMRLSVGLEDPEDLIEDFVNAMS